MTYFRALQCGYGCLYDVFWVHMMWQLVLPWCILGWYDMTMGCLYGIFFAAFPLIFTIYCFFFTSDKNCPQGIAVISNWIKSNQIKSNRIDTLLSSLKRIRWIQTYAKSYMKSSWPWFCWIRHNAVVQHFTLTDRHTSLTSRFDNEQLKIYEYQDMVFMHSDETNPMKLFIESVTEVLVEESRVFFCSQMLQVAPDILQLFCL